MSLKSMHELKSYLKKVTGLDVEELQYPIDSVQRLPVFIRESYNFSFCEFYEHQVVFVKPRSLVNITPNQLHRDIPKIESAFECPAILVFKELTYYLKEQLIKSRFSFVQPGKQLFIPFMFMDLREQHKVRITRTEHFSPSTQCVLIYHLWVRSIEGLNFQEIADLIEYTPRTIGRCAEEMEGVGLCKIVGSRSKYLEFTMNKRETWLRAIDYLASPVKESKWLFWMPNDPNNFKIAGVSALSKNTYLSSDNINSYAMYYKTFQELKNKGEVQDTIFNENDIQLQIWSYDPVILSKNEQVDPFSLYLSLRNDPDERVQMELDKMMEGILQ